MPLAFSAWSRRVESLFHEEGLRLRAHVAEPEDLAVHGAETAGADEPVATECLFPLQPGIAGRNHGCGHCRRVDCFRGGPERNAQRCQTGTALGRRFLMASEDVGQSFPEQGLRPGMERGDTVP